MCRIVGILNYSQMSSESALGLINNLTDKLEHGGPDDRGVYINVDDRIVLGHRRLSILDLSSAGNQPMPSEDKKLWLVFNGEIYNFQEIRETLISYGHSFSSNTDTEVILKSYIQWGVKSFERFIGMFSFCLYDNRINKTYLVRDQSGIKPLYYSFKNNRMIFSSETKSFRHFDSRWSENKNWKTYFLSFGFIPEPYTYLENVFMLPKGSYLEFDNNKNDYSIFEYANFNYSEENLDFDEAIYNIKELINQSVKRHLISDAPIGVFLSGGLDSSIISLCASRYKGEELNTLSIEFDENDYSEKEFQNIISSKIGSKHFSFLLKENEFIDSIENIFSAMDQPTTDGINTYFISKYAKQTGLKTVLSGIGADELFGGYPSFNRIRKLWFLNRINNSFLKPFSAFNYINNNRLKKLSYLSLSSPMNFYLLLRGIYNISTTSKILGLDKLEVLDCIEEIPLKNSNNIDSQNTASFLETDIYMKNQLLRDTDFMSMKNSVEVRVPFLDQDLVRYVLSLNTKIKFNKKTPKVLLNKAFSDLIPPQILNRNKQGFVFPFEIWMRRNIDKFSEMINTRNSEIETLIDNFRSGRLHWSRFWSLVVLNQKS